MAKAARDANPIPRLVDVQTIPDFSGFRDSDFIERTYPSLLIVPIVRNPQEWSPTRVPAETGEEVDDTPSAQTDDAPSRKYHAPRVDVKVKESEVITSPSRVHTSNHDRNYDPEIYRTQTSENLKSITSDDRRFHANRVAMTTTSSELLQSKTNYNINNTFNDTERNTRKPDKTSSENMTAEVDLNQRSSFQGDECASDSVKVNGKCVKKE